MKSDACPTLKFHRALRHPSSVMFQTLLSLALALTAFGQPAHPMSFEVAFPASLHAEPVAGRMFVFIARTTKASRVFSYMRAPPSSPST
jgi:hypothetical protein